MSRTLPILACLALAARLPAPASAADLGQKYPATLDSSEPPQGREWTCDPDDVWLLSSFSFTAGKQLSISLGPSTVVFGKNGTNVLWAVVLPDKPAPIVSTLDGKGERVASVWMRFNPARVGEFFPAKTVKKNGPPERIGTARRICQWKMSSCWQANNQPVVPWKRSVMLDVETAEGTRRFYSIDTDSGEVKHEGYWLNRGLPPLLPTTSKMALETFDSVWKAFDQEYAMFVVKPSVDWDRLKDKYRSRAEAAKTTYDVGAAIAALLAHLEDLHVWVRVGDEFVPGYDRPRPLNASWEAVTKTIAGFKETGKEIAWGRTRDGIGYVNVYGLGDAELPRLFDEALDSLGDTWAMILDLRFNGGGDELLGRQIASRFLDQKRVYSTNQYRSGPKHEQLGPKLAREFEPRGPWRYGAPVISLTGRRTMSSAESLALMMAQCPQVTTMGDRTAGSSANPRRLELPGKIVVNLPRWLDLDPDGKPIDAVGIEPEVPIATDPSAFTASSDPVLQAALERLRKIPEGERKPGKAGV